jgi:metal-responsive CopG/Arc/MetJ family transcriptional regulator
VNNLNIVNVVFLWQEKTYLTMAKETLSVTIDSELLKKFKDHSKENAINISGRIEILIRDYMGKIEKKK